MRQASKCPAGGQNPRIAIIGCGFGGIAMAVRLKRAGIDNFVIFDKNKGPGGTWWESRYPGAEADTSTHLYAFSFHSFDWTRSHARQEELQRYLDDVMRRHDLRRHARFGTRVSRIAWDDTTSTYTLLTDRGDEDAFDVVVTAVGLLNTPSYPSWPGLECFRGPKFHSQRWEPWHDLTGKRVAVVGTGSTSAQVVAAIAPTVERLLIFQRQPGWVQPKGVHEYSKVQRAAFAQSLVRRFNRMKSLVDVERSFSQKIAGSHRNKRAGERCRGYIAQTLSGRPDLQAAVTPSYEYFGKRPITDDGYYPSLLRNNVELVPRAVSRITPEGIVDAKGTEHPVDVLIMATGFQPSKYLTGIEVLGPTGRSLHEAWRNEPAAFLGMLVPGFPNFYILNGPNTNTVAVVFMLECEAGYVARAIRQMQRGRWTVSEVRPWVMNLYNSWLSRKLNRLARTELHNPYVVESGRIVTQLPYRPITFWLLTRTLGVRWVTKRTVRED